MKSATSINGFLSYSTLVYLANSQFTILLATCAQCWRSFILRLSMFCFETWEFRISWYDSQFFMFWRRWLDIRGWSFSRRHFQRWRSLQKSDRGALYRNCTIHSNLKSPRIWYKALYQCTAPKVSTNLIKGLVSHVMYSTFSVSMYLIKGLPSLHNSEEEQMIWWSEDCSEEESFLHA